MTYQEKSILGSLLATVLVAFYYGNAVFELLRDKQADSAASLLGPLVAVVVIVIIVEVAYNILIASFGNSELKDERDALIDAKTSHVAYFILTCGVILVAGHVVLGDIFSPIYTNYGVSPAFAQANLLILALMLAEICKFTLQLVYYRRGI
jgi:hypothetical protein